MQQAVVALGSKTLCVDVEDVRDIERVVSCVADRCGVPHSLLECTATDGRWYRLEWVERGLLGGKGGFGAALRASARKGGKTTTDFGACRDLNGRRLRHVNNEIRLRVWKEEKLERERAAREGKVWDARQSKLVNTESGIHNWFLSVPEWAAGARTRKGKGEAPKTLLCKDWERARERDVPAGAPEWWGCPRGKACRFAHGYRELAPEGRKKLAEDKRMETRRKEAHALQTFTDQVEDIKERVHESIAQGIQRSKVKAMSTAAEGEGENAYVVCLCGEIGIGETGEAFGQSVFATAAVPTVAVSSAGCWYFEVEILPHSGGAVQIGFATENFEPAEETNDGVGDTLGSWGFDPFRGKLFAEGEEFDAPQTSDAGVIVGCYLDLNRHCLLFSLNGAPVKRVEQAEKEDPSLLSISQESRSCFFFPAVSLEQGEFVRMNLGERTFVHRPLIPGCSGFAGSSFPPSKSPGKETLPLVTSSSSSSSCLNSNKSIDLSKCNSVEELVALGADQLKEELSRRGLKCGGTIEQRAERLFAVRNLSEDEIDDSLRPKTKKRKVGNQ